MIKVIGLGPGTKEALTIGAIDALKNSQNVYLRTEKHPTVEFLEEQGIKFNTFDNKYEEADDFKQVYESIACELINIYKEKGELVYAVPGHPLVAESSVSILLKLCEENNIEIDLLPAVSFIDAVIERLHIDPINGLKIVDAFEIDRHTFDKRVGTVITQVYDKFIASEVKLKLLDYYRDSSEMDIYYIRAAGIKGMEAIRKIKLYELDRQEDIDYLTSVYIPEMPSANKDFDDLLDIMSTLRGQKGCPWDKEQTHETLKRYLIEECYEVLEAIDNDSIDDLTEELGDVLLQVVFHSQIGEEEALFDIQDVIKGICDKMILRHPHIFGDVKAENSEEVLKNWDEIKKKEKALNSLTDELKHIPKNLPALMRAEKVQNKAKKVNFDFEVVEDAMDKVLEEVDEVKNVYKTKDRAKIEEEVGDLLFSSVNIARFLDIDPEMALNYTIDKFIRRFEYIEKGASEKGLNLKNMTIQQMDELWEESKKRKL